MRTWIERQRYLIDYTLAAMARRKGKNLGLLLVYTALVFLLASALLLGEALRREAAALLAGAPEVVVQRLTAGRQALVPADWLERLRAIRGVRGAAGRLWGYYYDPASRANFTLLVPPLGAAAPEPGRITIGAGIARVRGAGVGDVLPLRGYDGRLHSFRVAAVLPAGGELVSADLLLLGEADFRDLTGIAAGQYTDLALHVANPREVRKVAEKVVAQLPDSRPILRTELLRSYQSLFDWREGMVLVLLAGVVAAFAILAWEKAAGLSAEERREIGILKAVGWESGDVLRMKLWEGGLISLAAFLIGYTLAWWHVYAFSGALFEPALRGWAVLFPRFRLAPAVDGMQLATLFFFTVFPYTAATLVPVWRAATTDPDSAMR